MEINISHLGWVAWILTMLSWFISFLISKHNRNLSEINKISDNLTKSLRSIEDKSLCYWIKNKGDIYQYEFILDIKRISDDLILLSKAYPKFTTPWKEISELRKAITLNIESNERPVNEFSQRAREISISCYNIDRILPRV